MRILHGSWTSDSSDEWQGEFILWAETSEERETTHPHHPFAAPARDVQNALKESAPSLGPLLKREAGSVAVTLLLPSTRLAPQASSVLLSDPGEARGKFKLAPWQVEALCIPSHATLDVLAALPPEFETAAGVKIGADLRYWQAVARFALELLVRQRLKPVLLKDETRFIARWEPLLDEPTEAERIQRLERAMPPICRAVFRDGTGAKGDAGARSEVDARNAGPAPRALLDRFLATTIDAFARWQAVFELPPFPFHHTAARAWLAALCDRDPIVKGSSVDLAAFYDQYRAWAAPVETMGADTFRICFRLDPPPTEETLKIVAPTADATDWTLRYFLQASDDPSLLVPAETVWRERGSALQFLNRRFDAPQERLLAGLGMASRVFPPIEASLHTARPETCALNVEQAFTFIRETALLLQSAGFGVLVPGFGKTAPLGGLGVSVRVKTKKQPAQAQGGVGGLTFDSLIQYDWQLALGGEPLSRDEFERLAALKVPLVQVRGQWIELHPEQIEQAFKFWEKRRTSDAHGTSESDQLSMAEALRLALALEPATPIAGLPVTNVVTEGWFAGLVDQLAQGVKSLPVSPPASFHGTLRPYQATGLSWLAFLRQWGLGACLADDMGLGKTPTTIALLLAERAEQPHRKPALVICPTSVVNNWQRELERFAPDLRVLIHHGAGRKKTDLAAEAGRADVVLSSYALLHRDLEQLAAIAWGDVILDEAQNIKNPSTKQAQAARAIGAKAEWRAALTGTPVENRLNELWSLFQFLNPDYLGSQKDYYERLAKPIERTNDAAATKRLKALVNPFILRRVKTDPTVIDDLPAKNEMKVYCSLTKEQATLYEAVVRDSLKRIQESDGMARRGLVLATLMKLKQVCNHPAQFLGDGSALAGRSGKLARLTEMLEEVRGVGDRALVFTQFAEMGGLLKTYLQDYFAEEVLFLHGAVPAAARPKLIERFQSDPDGPFIFVLSIKAGGTGLNLMRANHVFHFDRWWNPAVENQATDRAFRIGQTKNVQVHKYLCAGTFEEKIDTMIERKQALAEAIVGTSEGWITELSTEQLRDLFALRRETIGD